MNKFRIISFLSFLMISKLTYAEHRHYQGLNPKNNEVCELMVEEEFFENNLEQKENYRAKVMTSFEGFEDEDHDHDDDHEHEHDELITVKFLANNPKALTGTSEDGDAQIAIVLKSESNAIENPNFFNIKRKHGNHYHVDTCKDLVVE